MIMMKSGSQSSAGIVTAPSSEARSRGIVVFTVAVNAPTAGQQILTKCATADSYAYNVTASGLTDAFASIASSINALRLTN